MLITKREDYLEACEKLRAAGRFALDTEFVKERSYYTQLGVVQVAAEGFEAVIDPDAVGPIDELIELVFDPEIEKIVHAGRQDFEIFYEMGGKAPRNIFDAQVAAAFVGYGLQISYANLVNRVKGLRLQKSHTLTDWTRRPLSPEQIDYALEDVRHLDEVRRHLNKRLDKLGRAQWARDEFDAYERADLYEKPAPEEYYRKMKSSGLRARELGVLRELAAWRERTAIERNVQRNSIARDEVLAEIARRKPTDLQALRSIRFLNGRTANRHAEDVLAAVRRGLDGPAPEMPRRGRRVELPPEAASLTRLLEAWLRAQAIQAEIAPEILATRADFDALCAGHFAGELPDIALLRGWRRELVGEDLEKILAGELLLGFDPKAGRIVSGPARN